MCIRDSRLSDTICIENGLSIVENPKLHGKSYNKWLGDQAKPSHRELLRVAIDNALSQSPADFEELLKLLDVYKRQLVHSGTVDPSQDNMLKITSDGRKLGLDQRIVNQMLPDEPGTKVNQCVDNIMQIWRDGKADKLTQLVFCDSVAIRCYK